MDNNEFIGGLSYYGKQIKDFTTNEKKLFSLDNLLLLSLINKKISEKEHDFLSVIESNLKVGILGKERTDLVFKLLNVTEEDKKNYKLTELMDMSENSVYSFSKFQETHLKYQDKLMEFIKDNPEHISNKEDKKDNIFPFSFSEN